MCSGRAWIVASSVGAVEAMKDQGLCRRNYNIKALRIIQGKNRASNSTAQAKDDVVSLSSERMSTSKLGEEGKGKKSEESLRTVMYLSCWGPNN